jgi:hypothetical protein
VQFDFWSLVSPRLEALGDHGEIAENGADYSGDGGEQRFFDSLIIKKYPHEIKGFGDGLARGFFEGS